jgi:amidohydrolase
MDIKYQRLFDVIEENKQKILDAETYIWEHPEIGYREWNTTRYISEHMKALGLEVHECGDIPGLWVDIDMEGEGPRLAVFAEMDGLYIPDHPDSDPETGAVHACAHHCQCAAMIGLATALTSEGALEGLCGSVRLFAVPAEEGIELDFRSGLMKQGVIKYLNGKQEFLYRGYLNDIDMAMMVHTCSKGIMCNVGSNGFISKRMTFIGKASHGASPERGLNALYAATNALAAANSIRELFGGDKNFRFHPIITKGGEAVNVIPSEVVVESFTRGADMKTIIAANEKINRAFAASAAALGCRLVIEDNHGACPRIDDANMTNAVYEAGKLLMPEEDIRMNGAWAAGCTDMGDVSAVIPSVHAHIGAGPLPGHTSTFRVIDHETATVTNAKLQAGIIVYLFSNAAEKAKQVISEAKLQYSSIEEYIADTEKASFHGDSVFYGEDGTVTIKYKK